MAESRFAASFMPVYQGNQDTGSLLPRVASNAQDAQHLAQTLQHTGHNLGQATFDLGTTYGQVVLLRQIRDENTELDEYFRNRRLELEKVQGKDADFLLQRETEFMKKEEENYIKRSKLNRDRSINLWRKQQEPHLNWTMGHMLREQKKAEHESRARALVAAGNAAFRQAASWDTYEKVYKTPQDPIFGYSPEDAHNIGKDLLWSVLQQHAGEAGAGKGHDRKQMQFLETLKAHEPKFAEIFGDEWPQHREDLMMATFEATVGQNRTERALEQAQHKAMAASVATFIQEYEKRTALDPADSQYLPPMTREELGNFIDEAGIGVVGKTDYRQKLMNALLRPEQTRDQIRNAQLAMQDALNGVLDDRAENQYLALQSQNRIRVQDLRAAREVQSGVTALKHGPNAYFFNAANDRIKRLDLPATKMNMTGDMLAQAKQILELEVYETALALSRRNASKDEWNKELGGGPNTWLTQRVTEVQNGNITAVHTPSTVPVTQDGRPKKSLNDTMMDKINLWPRQ